MNRECRPVVDRTVRGLCVRAYPGHPRGCPNYGHKVGCPPKAPTFWDLFDEGRPIVAVWSVFDLRGHIERMRGSHPGWSERQLRNCLYWQAGARKVLREEVELVESNLGVGSLSTMCPEGLGVNVTETMKGLGVELEWPPERVSHLVAMVGYAV